MPITDPTDITELELWLDADQIVGLSDGDPVSQWDDESGNARHATQAVGSAQPLYKTSIVPTSNKPVLRFDGSDDSLALPNFLTGFTAGEIFVVARADFDPAQTSAKSASPVGDFGSDSAHNHFPFTDGNVYEDFGSTVRKSCGNPAASLSSAFRIIDMYSAANDWEVLIDDTSLFSTTTNTVGWGTAPLLGSSGLGNRRYDGDIAEVVLFSRKLSASERTDMFDYLDDKYNTAGGGSSVVPTGHLYGPLVGCFGGPV